MPSVPPTSIATRKRTRSTNMSENNHDHQQTASSNTSTTTITTLINNNSSHSTNTVTVNAPPKRQRNNPPPTGPPPPVAPRTTYSFRNRSLTPDPRHLITRFPSVHPPSSRSNNQQRYNLRSRRPQSQVRLPQVPTTHPIIPPRRTRPLIPPIIQTTTSASSSTNVNQSSSLTLQTSLLSPSPPRPPSASILPVVPPITHLTPPMIQPRQYRLVYISDDDDEPQATATVVNTTLDLVTEDDDDELIRSHIASHHRLSRSTVGAGFNTRLRTGVAAVPSSATSTSSSSSSSSSNSTTATINTQDFVSGVAYVRLNRAIEIVIDSIQSLEGAVNSFDQLIFALIYGRLNTRDESESIEGMIRLSRILNLSLPSRLSQDEIDALPKIIFVNKSGPTSSILLVEKCPICLNEFDDQETINKLHCTHLFHLQCISTWLSENDSCPTCRRKVMGD
ncbi:unnamed protein product [Rotaria sordida]|uniref:RING-type domain-containing protein n=1 Tax=Rotaria sordida TaxID=392033 RepID=A0A813SEJ0_9BILA|nr:unnamed protein product [Rotaria sordida]CAF0857767.1 unnamed protein product [Rotaria sordida]CAF0904031.1 unnamed protein product [Rotaria sordida]CAF3583487.1 unnamed protein product [Rotaria sordida]